MNGVQNLSLGTWQATHPGGKRQRAPSSQKQGGGKAAQTAPINLLIKRESKWLDPGLGAGLQRAGLLKLRTEKAESFGSLVLTEFLSLLGLNLVPVP